MVELIRVDLDAAEHGTFRVYLPAIPNTNDNITWQHFTPERGRRRYSGQVLGRDFMVISERACVVTVYVENVTVEVGMYAQPGATQA